MYLSVIGFCDLLIKFYVGLQQKIWIAPKQLIYARFDVFTTFLVRFSDLLNLFSYSTQGTISWSMSWFPAWYTLHVIQHRARERQSLLGAPADRAIFSCQLLAGVGHRLKWEQIAQCSSQWRPSELAVGTCWHSACNNARCLERSDECCCHFFLHEEWHFNCSPLLCLDRPNDRLYCCALTRTYFPLWPCKILCF